MAGVAGTGRCDGLVPRRAGKSASASRPGRCSRRKREFGHCIRLNNGQVWSRKVEDAIVRIGRLVARQMSRSSLRRADPLRFERELIAPVASASRRQCRLETRIGTVDEVGARVWFPAWARMTLLEATRAHAAHRPVCARCGYRRRRRRPHHRVEPAGRADLRLDARAGHRRSRGRDDRSAAPSRRARARPAAASSPAATGRRQQARRAHRPAPLRTRVPGRAERRPGSPRRRLDLQRLHPRPHRAEALGRSHGPPAPAERADPRVGRRRGAGHRPRGTDHLREPERGTVAGLCRRRAVRPARARHDAPHEEGRHAVSARGLPIHRTIHDGTVRRVEDEVFWRKDGSSFPVEYTTAPIRNERNETTGAVVVFRDITGARRRRNGSGA